MEERRGGGRRRQSRKEERSEKRKRWIGTGMGWRGGGDGLSSF